MLTFEQQTLECLINDLVLHNFGVKFCRCYVCLEGNRIERIKIMGHWHYKSDLTFQYVGRGAGSYIIPVELIRREIVEIQKAIEWLHGFLRDLVNFAPDGKSYKRLARKPRIRALFSH